MDDDWVEVSPAWARLALEHYTGTLLVIGGPDVGKSTFARYLCRRLCAAGKRVALLDGDPGQSQLGPPTTMTLAMAELDKTLFPESGRRWRRCVGSVSPRGHMLSLVVGAARLVAAAQAAGAEAVVYDTSGLVDPSQGGAALKRAKIDLLCPTAVFAIHRGSELEALLRPLRLSRRVDLVELQPSLAVRRRDPATRRAYRAARFADYFAGALTVTVDLRRIALIPTAPRFVPHRLAAFQGMDGFTLGLGITVANSADNRQWSFLTPLKSLAAVETLSLGDVILDPETFGDRRQP